MHKLWLVLLLLCFAEVKALEEDESAWLASMRQAMSHLNYQGLMAYSKDNKVESFKVFHSASEGIEQERLLSLNSPMREVVRNAEKVSCYFPDSRTVFVESKSRKHSFLLDLPDDLTGLAKHYTFKLGDIEYVAQRPSRLLNVIPKDDFRYGRKIWVDVETRLPIKFELFDEDQKVVEQMVFTQLSVEKSIPLTDLESSTLIDGNWKISRHETLATDALAWAFEDVPEGFQMMSYSRLKRDPERKPIEHILLSDGFSSVSIYIDEMKNEYFTAHPRKIGAINSYTRKIDKYLVTVMGEVPAKTVQAIGNGVRHHDAVKP